MSEFSSKDVSKNRHHEQAKSVQLKFIGHMSALIDMIKEMGKLLHRGHLEPSEAGLDN